MSLYPRESRERNSLVNLSRQWTHITDADGFPLCCNEPQPAPKTAHGLCPICKMIKSTLPDTVTVEPLPFDALADEDNTCPDCGGSGVDIVTTGDVFGSAHEYPFPCATCGGRG